MKRQARYLLRACLWSIPAYLVWELVQPLAAPLVDGLVHALLLPFSRSREVDVTRLNRGAVLFLILLLAHRPPWRRAVARGALGVAACMVAEGIAIATLVAIPEHRSAGERLLRGLAVGTERVMPILAWLYLAREWVFPWIATLIEDGTRHAETRGVEP